MREILFRGKRIFNSKWVEGFMYSQHFPLEFRDDFYIRCYDTDYLVIPETVGQFTGLTDKNGVRIFEGDIVDYISSDVIGNPKTGTIIVEDMTDYDTMIYLNHSDELQIIGNIHDNPELLGKAENP